MFKIYKFLKKRVQNHCFLQCSMPRAAISRAEMRVGVTIVCNLQGFSEGADLALLEASAQIGLVQEALAEVLVGRQVGVHQLDGDIAALPLRPALLDMAGADHLAHAALADGLQDPIAAQLGRE